jgi:ribosomal protein S4
MAEKLLEKSRNLFLSLTPPENLIPKKRVKASKRNRYQRRRVKSYPVLNKFFHEKNQRCPMANIHISPACKMPFLKNLSLEDRNIIPPIDHSAVDKLHFAIGGNINRFLKTEACLPLSNMMVTQPSIGGCGNHEKKNNKSNKHSPGASCMVMECAPCMMHLIRAPGRPGGAGSAASMPHGLGWQKADSSAAMHRRCKASIPSQRSVDALRFPCPEVYIGQMQSSYPHKEFTSPFYLKWNKENPFLDGFIKGRFSKNIWNSLFSSYDLNYVYNNGDRFPIRIKNQHKNELMEKRKIAIEYGNLSRDYLARLMQRSGKSKFLSTLERRLDVVLKRALFFPSIWTARQWINQGKILVNYEICSYNSYLLQPGDLISIKEEYKSIWKKEWFKNIGEFDFLKESSAAVSQACVLAGDPDNINKRSFGEVELSPVRRASYRFPCKENIEETINNVALSNPGGAGLRGRFLFSSHLMRKWDKWCQLWGRSISHKKDDGHSWSKLDYAWNLSLHPVFNNSVCADNLYLESFMQLKNNINQLKYAHRRSTPILLWLEELYRNSLSRKKGRHYMYQLISSLLLLQQRGPIIDGLFQQRWRRLFTKKKPKILKKIGCRWGPIKPMHLECSYSCATVIYLFAPQKLVWPSHINVLLLKSALNG